MHTDNVVIILVVRFIQGWRMKTSRPKISESRRRFLRDASRTAVGVGAAASLLGLQSLQSQARETSGVPIRPPGALPGNDFEKACVRCGLCVQACPYDTLKLASLLSPVAAGTPYFTARQIPCEMCEDIPCVKACPSGALDPSLTDIDDARMGTAVLIDQKNCLNFQGLRCDVCYPSALLSIKPSPLKPSEMKEQVFTPNLFPPFMPTTVRAAVSAKKPVC